jgi:hypothetical protein
LIAQHSFHAQKEIQRRKRLPAPIAIRSRIYAISLECRMDQPVVRTG